MTTDRLELRGRRLQLLSSRLTQRTYDRAAPIYPLTTLLFHRRAHRRLLQLAGSLEGRTVMEVAVGSGELFRELLKRNSTGLSVGVDLSPGMVSMVKKRLNGNHGRNGGRNGSPNNGPGQFSLQAVDARQMPFPAGAFDALFNCYLFCLLSPDDIQRTIAEFHRVLRPGGKLLMVNDGEGGRAFNAIYGSLGYVVPSFWGRQVAAQVPRFLEDGGFRIRHHEVVSQTFYPSAVILAER